MPRTSFRQRDLEQIFLAAKVIDATVQIDPKTRVVTVLPAGEEAAQPINWPPDGNEERSDIQERRTMRLL